MSARDKIGPTAGDATGDTVAVTTRIAVTLAVLLVYVLGRNIPLPGIDPAAIAALLRSGSPGLGLERVSLLSLGVVPLLSTYVLAETLRLVSPAFARWQAVPANDRRLQRWLRGLALLMAALQAWGVGVALEGIERVVTAPGWPFRIGVMATLVAATAVVSWLADAASRYGLGNGFWLLAALPVVAETVPRASEALAMYRMGAIGDGAVIASAAFIALSVAALVRLDRARHATVADAPRVSVWPPFLAYTAGGWIAAWAIAGGDPRQSWMAAGQPGHLLLLALLIGVFALRDGATPAPGSASAPTAPAGGQAAAAMGSVAAAAAARAASSAAAAEVARQRGVRLRLAGLVALVQIAICVAGELLQAASPFAIPGMWLIAVVAVALGVLDVVRRDPEAASGADPASGPGSTQVQ